MNGPQGLEHGFMVAKRPEGDGALVFELAAEAARARLSGDAVLLDTGAGRKLRYGKLAARDANGLALDAHFEVPAPDRVQLVVADAGAAYPLTIDPLLSAAADTQVESNQAGARFGISVSSAGDVNGDGYDDVIVGADSYDAGTTDEGAAFVFHGSSNGIASGGTAVAATQLESNQGGSGFGASVSSAGDVNGDGYADVIVGADLYDAGATNEGVAFVYYGSTTGIASGGPSAAAARLEGDQASANFGGSVSSAGDVNGDGYADVIVGAYLYSAGELSEGAAFVFQGSASGIGNRGASSADARLEGGQPGAYLGYSVSSAGDVNGDGFADVIAGAIYYDGGQTDEGAAFVFHGSASGIGNRDASSADAWLESNQASAAFGTSVSSAGDVNGDGFADVIAGALVYDAGEMNEGAAFVFHGSASGIGNRDASSADAMLDSDQPGAYMGQSVASAGDVDGDGYADVIVEAIFYHGTGENFGGTAFVFHGSASGIADGDAASADATLETGQLIGAFSDRSVSSAGDVNGDGYADVIFGAYLYSAGESQEGAAFVYHGGSKGIADATPATAASQLESNQANTWFGTSVSSAGDVNGDGYGDVIVGAPYYDSGQVNEGAAFVFLGSSTGIGAGTPVTAHAQLEADQASAFFGESVSSAGDVNGDGYADVIVGAHGYNYAPFDEGSAFVFLGSASGIADGSASSAHGRIGSDQDGWFGSAVSSAGDVNGDGYADVIVGASFYNAGGAAFVFLGSAAGIGNCDAAGAHARLESDQTSARFGSSVATAGDVNGDGYADVIVGAPYFAAGQPNEGAAFVFPVDDPGNAPDATGFGSTPFEYEIGTFEVTTGQYAAFLNAVADDDPNGLFNDLDDPRYQIHRVGSPGSYAYETPGGMYDLIPTNFVSLYDAMRFVNWLENGQPVGAQGPNTTEDGAYTITPAGIAANSIARNPGSRFALPSEHEWYKAAYYDSVGDQYFAYPTGSNTQSHCAYPGAPESANCGDALGLPWFVGSYTDSASPNGTFDQGGNVWEWTDEVSGADRRVRGGAFDNVASVLSASNSGLAIDPLTEADNLGFRVVPEPGRLASLIAGAAALLALRRRRSAALR